MRWLRGIAPDYIGAFVGRQRRTAIAAVFDGGVRCWTMRDGAVIRATAKNALLLRVTVGAEAIATEVLGESIPGVPAALEKITGRPLAALFEERIVEPLGLTTSGTDPIHSLPGPALHTFTTVSGPAMSSGMLTVQKPPRWAAICSRVPPALSSRLLEAFHHRTRPLAAWEHGRAPRAGSAKESER